MLFTIILFFLTTAIAFAMIAHKVWQLRSGRIATGSYEEADWHDLSIESIRLRLLEVAKFSVHHFVLYTLKLWILISSFIRRTDARIKYKLTHLIHKNGHLPAGGEPSVYLKDIKGHKDEVSEAIVKEGME